MMSKQTPDAAIASLKNEAKTEAVRKFLRSSDCVNHVSRFQYGGCGINSFFNQSLLVVG
jgi:hypothetical protein